MSNNTREEATITRAYLGRHPASERGCTVVDLMCEGDGWGQGFCVITGEQHLASARQTILNTFQIIDEKELVGKKCFVLRNLPYGSIEGLEAESGKRFLRSAWARSINPQIKTAIEQKRESLEASIRSHLDTAHRLQQELNNLSSNFVDWEDHANN